MAGAPIRKPQVYGNYRDHERELVFSSREPLYDRHPTPEPVVIGDYRISFTDKVFGGYLANIVRTDGVVVARGAKISRFMQSEYIDPETDTSVYIKLNLIDGATLHLTAFSVVKGFDPASN